METSRQQSSKTDHRAAPSLQKFSGLSELRSQLRSWRGAIALHHSRSAIATTSVTLAPDLMLASSVSQAEML